LSDPLDEAYEKYLSPEKPQERPPSDVDIEAKITCPNCDSENVDKKAGYRGEYKCLECGHYWQVGGFAST